MSRANAIEPVADLEALFRATKNPLYVWQAICMRLALPGEAIPAWCLEYLDQSAAAISNLALRHKGDSAEKARAVAGALGVTRPGWNSFDAFAADALNNLAVAMQEHLEQHGGSANPGPMAPKSALDLVRKRTGVGRSRLFRAKKAPRTKYLQGTAKRKD